MLESRDLYRDYINSIQNRLNTITIKLDQYTGSINYLKNCITNNQVEFEKEGVSITTLFAAPFIAYSKIKPLVDTGKLTRVAHYVRSYTNANLYYNTHKLLYDRLTKSIMPYETYLKFLFILNSEIAKYILNGGYYNFGQLGRIYICEKPRAFLFKGKPVKLPIDWGASNKYKQYLIDNGKVPYDSVSAPDGIKWHIYHDSDYAYWFIWEKLAFKNKAFFKFCPSKFVRRGKAKLIPFTSKEQILNSSEIGNINKMVELLKFDTLHFINYKRPEKIKKNELIFTHN